MRRGLEVKSLYSKVLKRTGKGFISLLSPLTVSVLYSLRCSIEYLSGRLGSTRCHKLHYLNSRQSSGLQHHMGLPIWIENDGEKGQMVMFVEVAMRCFLR